MGRSAAPTFYFGTPSISQKLMDLGSGSLVCLWDFMSTRVLCKNLSAGGGRLERSAAPNIFYFWTLLHIYETNGARRLKFGTLYRHLEVLRLHVKFVR